MRPEDVAITHARADQLAAVPLDVAVEALDVELEATGARGRRMLNGQRQPTRYFTLELRHELLEAMQAGPARSAGEPQPREVSPVIRP